MQDAVCSPGPPPQTSCRIQLLGELRVTFAGQEVPRALTRKIGGLLGYLACFHHRAHSRDALIELFWPEVDLEAGRASLRGALPLLRRLLEPPGVPPGSLLLADRQTVRLDPERVTTDVEEFERDVQAAARAASPSEQAVLLERALSGYGGELLPGYYEPWVLTERERLAAAYVAALRQLAAARAQQGDLEGAIDAARRAVQADPLEEAAHYDLIRHYAAAGQTAAARRQYLELERLLKAELEVTPSQSLSALLDEGERSRAWSLPAPPSPLSSERVPFPPPLPLSSAPVPLTPFFGREEEIAQVRALLEGGDTRLVTLTGPGGVGKTRLALQVAADLLDAFTDGVFFVDLAPIRDPGLVPSAIAQTLGVGETGGQPLLETLKRFLHPKSFLLVLDNFEQVLEAGPTVAELLAAAPRLKVLVTSRAALRLRSEKEFAVLPLALPDLQRLPPPEAVSQYAAVGLFVQRALDVQPDFEVTRENAPVVAEICHRLDGLPLALELAAARLKLFSPQALLSRLENRLTLLTGGARDLPARQQTLRGTIEWSYDLLSEAERTLMARLSVFAGGWDLEAAEQVCSDCGLQKSGTARSVVIRNEDVLDLLTGLIDQSWIVGETRQGARRYRFLETIREYSMERLQAAGEGAELRARHGEYFLQLAEAAEPELTRSGQAVWLARLESEHENLRAALAWYHAEEGGAEAELRLAGALGRFWRIRGYLSEGRASLAEALEREEAIGPAPVRARALNWAGELALSQRDYQAATAQYEESLALYRQLGDRGGVASVLRGSGHVLEEQGDRAAARQFHEESLAIRRELDDKAGIALSLNHLGNLALQQGEYGAARARYTESLALSRELGDKPGEYTSRQLLGVVAEHEGDLVLAGAIYGECLQVWRELGFQMQVAWAQHGLGHVASRQGEFAAARSLLTNSLRMFHEMETTHGLDFTLERLGALAAAQGQMQRAARLLAAGASQRAMTGTVFALATQQEIARDVAAVRAAMDTEAFTAAWEAGRAMTLEQAIEYALQGEEQPPPPSPVSPERLPFPTPLPLSPVPVPLTPFFGREEEIAQVCAMLESASTRLVTLTGLGGAGKTRLALEVARRLQQEGSDWAGVAFVSLVDLTDPRLLLQTLRGALNLPAAGDNDPLEQIATSLANQQFLLVLDNFEQLLHGGAATVEQLLERVPRLVCLVTSRRPLGLTAEADYLVPPLPTPAAPALPEQLLEFASVRLFLNRAQAARPEFQVTAANAEAVTRLCQALEGIPLALELAAARSPVLTPAQMLQHLADRFSFLVARHRDVAERHRTLRAALEWSYQSLPEHQQRLLARLSVFRGGWTLEAAEAVCGDEAVGRSGAPPRTPPAARVPGPGDGGAQSDPTPTPRRSTATLDQLLELRNAALVIAEEAGEAMRYRMLDTVREYGEERLAAWGEAEVVRERHRDWYLGLAEHADRVFEGYGGPEQAAWLDRLNTEHDNLRAALACCFAEESGAEMGLRLATALVQFWEVRGYLSEGRTYLAEALGREAAGRPTPERARALSGAAVLAWMQGDSGAARALLEESLAVSRGLGAGVEIAWSIHQLGHVASIQGDYEMARGLYEESLAMFRELGHPSGIATSLAEQGNVALKQRNLEAARSFYEESLAISRELGNKVSIAVALNNLGKIAREQGDPRTARALHGESLEIRQELGDKGGFPWSLEAFARLAAPVEPERAARLWGAAEALRDSLGLPLPPNERPEYDRHRAAVREALGEEAFARAWAAGREMALEEAIRCALETDDA